MILISLFLVNHRFDIVFPNKSLFSVKCSSSRQYHCLCSKSFLNRHQVFINKTSTRVSLLEKLARCAVNLYRYLLCLKKTNIKSTKTQLWSLKQLARCAANLLYLSYFKKQYNVHKKHSCGRCNELNDKLYNNTSSNDL